MKHKKILSLLLSALILLTLLSPITVTAVDEIPDMPGVLPGNESVDMTNLWIDWSAAGCLNNANTVTADGMMKINKAKTQVWSGASAQDNTQAWRGASGLMFYVNTDEIAADAAVKNVNFMVEFLIDQSRLKGDGSSGYAQFNTVSTTSIPAKAYYYQNGEWHVFQPAGNAEYMDAGVSFSGWYYVPLTSLSYRGGSGWLNSSDEGAGMNFVEFMTHFTKQNLARLSFRSQTPGLKFGDVSFVYHMPEAISENTSSAPTFSNLTLNTHEGGASSQISGSSVTVSSLTANSAGTSGSRVWLKGINTANLHGATGIRFWVDSSSLDAGASLQLRLRLLATPGCSAITDIMKPGSGYQVFGSGTPQYVCRGDNSVAYYYDESGAAQVLRVNAGVSTVADADLFEALPEGYRGYIYIPFDSFWMSVNSYNSGCYVPFADVSETFSIQSIAICHAISGTTANDSVTYSNFETVYADTAITGANVVLTNNFNVNFYAEVQEGVQDVSMQFVSGSKNETVKGTLQEDGSWRFVCEDLLPQTIVNEISATLNVKINGKTVSQKMTYSIRQYCENMLEKDSTPLALKTLLVDMLFYGEAAQKYANYKTDDLATKNLTDEQRALASEDMTASITKSAVTSGTPNADYQWVSASLRMENTTALKLKFSAANLEGLTVEVTIGDRTVVFDHFAEGADGYTVVFNNIGANEFDQDVTAVIKQNGVVIGQTLTYSVSAYIREAVSNDATPDEVLSLLRAMYAYGCSAVAYCAD